MTSEQHHESSSHVVTPLPPGAMLAAAREQAGLSQQQVAKDLYMTLTKVRALESDDYRQLHSDTFIRGYLRAYASLLKMDLAPLLVAYERQLRTLGLAVEPVLPQTQAQGKKMWLFVVAILLSLLLLWLISVWFFDNKREPVYLAPPVLTLPETGTVPAVAPSVDEPVAVLISSESDDASASAVVPSSAASQMLPSEPQAEQRLTPVISQQLDATQALDELQLVFDDECWLEVSDARGDVLAAELQRPGSRLVLRGKAPFDVILGNARAAHVSLNGSRVEFVAPVNTNVLSLQIGSQ